MKQILMGVSLAVLASAGVAITAHAQNQPGPDPLGDKAVTRAEAQAKAEQRFTEMDANKDGKLDAADKAARQSQKFVEIDTDKNGSLNQAEFAAAHQRRMADAPGKDGPPRAGRMMQHGGMHHGKMMGGGKLADGNGDGTVTRAEFVAAHLKMFDLADGDKNGTVTKAERQAAHARMREMRGDGAMPPPPPPAN